MRWVRFSRLDGFGLAFGFASQFSDDGHVAHSMTSGYARMPYWQLASLGAFFRRRSCAGAFAERVLRGYRSGIWLRFAISDDHQTAFSSNSVANRCQFGGLVRVSLFRPLSCSASFDGSAGLSRMSIWHLGSLGGLRHGCLRENDLTVEKRRSRFPCRLRPPQTGQTDFPYPALPSYLATRQFTGGSTKAVTRAAGRGVAAWHRLSDLPRCGRGVDSDVADDVSIA
jgi:hypothetical protein